MLDFESFRIDNVWKMLDRHHQLGQALSDKVAGASRGFTDEAPKYPNRLSLS